MRGREEFLASAITSAIGMTSPTAPERERGSVGGYQRVSDRERERGGEGDTGGYHG